MIVPQAFIAAGLFGGVLYDPPELHGDLERYIFFQGSTDWGGGCLFAGTVALYVAFGFTAAWYLALKMTEIRPEVSYCGRILKSLWLLKFHIIAFIIGGTAGFDEDTRVAPNDFRNMFVLASVIYALSILLIAVVPHRVGLAPRILVAPLFTIFWIIVGSDGNTARAGQLVQSDQDPQPIIRSKRHAVMMSWHNLCDSAFGDIRLRQEEVEQGARAYPPPAARLLQGKSRATGSGSAQP